MTPIGTILTKWIRGNVLATAAGYTPDAQKHKRASGEWLEGIHWKKAPDGHIVYNWRAIDDWAEGKPVEFTRASGQ